MKKTREIDQFRGSLLCTGSKIFFSILSRRLNKFQLTNNYINTSVQKSGIPGFPGYP